MSEPEVGADTRVGEVRAVLARAIRAADAYGRPDLVDRLQGATRQVEDTSLRVVVVGEYKQGKSSLINALLGIRVCPVDDDVATAVPTLVRDGPDVTAVAVVATDEGAAVTVPVADADLDEVITSAELPGGDRVLAVEVQAPRRLLRDGMVLIDTPGAGGLDAPGSAASTGELIGAAAVLFVTDASQELTASELAHLRAATVAAPTAVVLSKVDVYGSWREIRDRNAAHLAAAGLSCPIVPVSSVLRNQAVAQEDRALNAESGFVDLLATLREDLLASQAGSRRDGALADTLDAIDQMAVALTSERDVLSDPASSADLLARLQRAESQSAHLRSPRARWQQTLNDGISDTSSDAEYQLRDSLRALLVWAETEVDAMDPSADLEPWSAELHRRVTADVRARFADVHDRAVALAERVADHFRAAELEVSGELTADVAPPTLASQLSTPEFERTRLVSQAFTALRGSYSGLLMFGMLAQVAGLALTGPAMLAVGVLLGGRSVREDRQRRLTARRQQAKAAVHLHLDEVSTIATKGMRDALRAVHRDLRDHYEQRASELMQTTQRALASAQEALQRHERDRVERGEDLDAELQRLQALRADVLALGSGP